MNAGGGDARENVGTATRPRAEAGGVGAGPGVPESVAPATRLLDEAGACGADLAALPELWPLYDTPAAMRAIAAPIPGPLTDPVAEVARARSLWGGGGARPGAAEARNVP